MKMVKNSRSVLIVCLVVSLKAATVQYSGRVMDTGGNAVDMARVEMEAASLYTYSDNDGTFMLEGDAGGVGTVAPFQKTQAFDVSLDRTTLRVRSSTGGDRLGIELFRADGRRVFGYTVSNRRVLSVNIRSVMRSKGLYVLRVAHGSGSNLYTIISSGSERPLLQHGHAAAGGTTGNTYGQVDNVIRVEAPGYYPKTFPQTSLEATGLELVVDHQNSDTLNSFQRFFTGNGRVKNIATGKMITIPEERRIHVILFPEGYLQGEYDEAKYVRDCLTWYRSVFAYAPMLFFRECFVIWRYPVVSNEHVNSNGVADTWFRLQLSGGGMTSELGVATEKIWGLMDGFPFPPEQFYSGRGLTAGRAKNVIAQMLVFDPSRDKAWFSGIATAIRNPDNQQQLIGIAMAQDQQHEFMHVLAHLLDEYYETDHSPLQSSLDGSSSGYLTNVAPTGACDALPWKHLVYGGANNPDVDSLVGAFGANGRFHPELYCLMNGSHDNKDLFGGNGQLRVYDRLCNFCRELTAFRIYERLGVLENDATSWADWIAGYRAPFYNAFPFNVPENIPQENSDRQPQWFPCNN